MVRNHKKHFELKGGAGRKSVMRLPFSIIEMFFWLATITVVIFVNISSRALLRVNTFFITVLLFALLIVILLRIYYRTSFANKRAVLIGGIGFIALSAYLLFRIGAAKAVIFYYLPALIAFSMALLLIVDPRSPILILVAVCTFILWEGFWNIQVGANRVLEFPAVFLRVFSLTLVTIFSYYLYRKEIIMRKELGLLNESLKNFDRMKSEFVANVSHELRTPLASIKNAVALFKKKIDDPQKPVAISNEELINIVSSNVDRQARLIESLLDLAKIEKGRIGASRVFLNVGDIARRTLGSLILQAESKNIDCSVEIEQNLPSIYATESQIEEAYTNLLENAIKYTGENGRVFLKVRDAGDAVESVIEDTGMGIKEEDIEKLFNKFVRLGNAMDDPKGGVGLGLVITKEIIESHGGKIWAESKIGEGSRFIFTLPLGLRKIDQRKKPKG